MESPFLLAPERYSAAKVAEMMMEFSDEDEPGFDTDSLYTCSSSDSSEAESELEEDTVQSTPVQMPKRVKTI